MHIMEYSRQIKMNEILIDATTWMDLKDIIKFIYIKYIAKYVI